MEYIIIKMLNNDETQFDIRIKDNFFNEEDFNKIKLHAQNTTFKSNNINYTNEDKHVFFTENASKEILDILSKQVSDFFKVKILNIHLCQFSLVAKSDKVEAHKDFSATTNFQTIFYIEGNEDIHSGTGFYIKKKENEYILNTHVGFKPNRIVSWASNVYHAPLSFSDSYKKRISLITQYKIENK